MKNNLLVKRLVGVAALTALVVGLQLFSNYIQFGNISITLALIPVAVGAILYGPYVGAFLGMVLGAIALTAPSTAGFLGINAWATVLICLVKTGLAGLVAGFVFKAFAFFGKKQPEKKNRVIFFAIGIIASALLVPVINTGVFILGAFAFFREPMGGTFAKILAAVLTTNFLIEFLVSAIMSPALVSLVKVLTKNYDLGFVNDFSSFIDNDEDEAFSEAVSL